MRAATETVYEVGVFDAGDTEFRVIERPAGRLLRAAEDPRDVRRLLERLASALELTAARVPVPEKRDRFLVRRKEQKRG